MRIAAHYILLPQKTLKLHFIELDNSSKIVKIAPLIEEISGTAFYEGIIFPSSLKQIDRQMLVKLQEQKNYSSLAELLFDSGIIASEHDFPVFIYQLRGVDLSSPKFGAGDSCSHCHIQRL